MNAGTSRSRSAGSVASVKRGAGGGKPALQGRQKPASRRKTRGQSRGAAGCSRGFSQLSEARARRNTDQFAFVLFFMVALRGGTHENGFLLFARRLIFTEEARARRRGRSGGYRGGIAHPVFGANYGNGNDRRFFDIEHAGAALGHLIAEAGSDDGDFHLFAHALVLHGSENDVGIFMRGRLDERGGLVDLRKLEGAGAGDVDEDAAGTVDGAGVEQAAMPWRPARPRWRGFLRRGPQYP